MQTALMSAHASNSSANLRAFHSNFTVVRMMIMPSRAIGINLNDAHEIKLYNLLAIFFSLSRCRFYSTLTTGSFERTCSSNCMIINIICFNRGRRQNGRKISRKLFDEFVILSTNREEANWNRIRVGSVSNADFQVCATF